MERFWKAALGVAGIGAIGLFVLWSLYKQWLTLPIFPILTQEQAYQLLLCFLILTFGAAFLGIIAYIITHRPSHTNSRDIPRYTQNLRLPNGSRFTNAQFDTYRDVWVTLQSLREAGDALWSHASRENLDEFIRALRLATTQVNAGGIFFEHDDYKQLTDLLRHFGNYQIGKQRLIKLRTAQENGELSRWQLEEAQQQIQQNQQHLKSYIVLLDKMRGTYHDRISWEHQPA